MPVECKESRGCHENQPCHPVASNNQHLNDISFVHLYVPSPSLTDFVCYLPSIRKGYIVYRVCFYPITLQPCTQIQTA